MSSILFAWKCANESQSAIFKSNSVKQRALWQHFDVKIAWQRSLKESWRHLNDSRDLIYIVAAIMMIFPATLKRPQRRKLATSKLLNRRFEPRSSRVKPKLDVSVMIPFLRTTLPLCRTRWVWSTFSSHCPLSSNQGRWKTLAALIIFFLWKNSGLLGVKPRAAGWEVICSICAMYY